MLAFHHNLNQLLEAIGEAPAGPDPILFPRHLAFTAIGAVAPLPQPAQNPPSVLNMIPPSQVISSRRTLVEESVKLPVVDKCTEKTFVTWLMRIKMMLQ